MAQIEKRSQDHKKRILFLGNSYIYYNSLDVMFNNMVGGECDIETHTVGGESLCGHSSNEKVKDLLSQKWDFVILQDLSTGPLPEKRKDTIHSLSTFYRPLLIESGTKNVILYQTWGRRRGIESYTYTEMQDELINGYEQFKDCLSLDGNLIVKIAPAGQIRLEIYKQDNDPLDERSTFYQMYTKDDSHPTPLGTYASACAIYSTIYNKSPTSLTFHPQEISQQQANHIQTIAHKVMS
ncbi:hypothetical protein AKO1_015723, partial [Acrasis kona]